MRKKDLEAIASMITYGKARAADNADPTIGIWFVADNAWYTLIAHDDKARKWYPNRIAWMQACGFEHVNYHAQS